MNQRLNAPSPSEAQRTQKVGNGAPRPARRAPAARTPGQGLREPQVWMASQPQAVGLVSGSTGTMSFLQLGDGFRVRLAQASAPGPRPSKASSPGARRPFTRPLPTEGLSPRLRPSGLVTKLPQPASLSLPPARPDTTCHQPGGLTGETRQTGRVCMKLGEFAHLLMASQPPSESREPQLMTYHLAVASPSEGLFLWPLK